VEFSPKPVNRLRQQIEEQLLEGIVSGSLTDGDKLPPETQLAEMFSVSRSTVREALGSLAQAGLIEKTTGATGGSFVRRPDSRRLGTHVAQLMDILVRTGSATREDVTAVRAMLEVPASRLAAMNRTEEDLVKLQGILETARGRTTEAPDLAALDMEFHGAIASASGNPLLSALVRALHATTNPTATFELTKDSGRHAFHQHEEMFEAIANQDPDPAEYAIRSHLSYLNTLAPKRKSQAQKVR
jgi:GntR family transcriptional regulator, transcriptional repressor for pyruvate dehydrogenase complex